MRSLVAGLIGAVLAVGATQAGDCRPGHVAFVEQANENRPGRLLTIKVTDFSSVTKTTEQGAYRTMSALGAAKGKANGMFRHGRYTAEAVAERRMLGAWIRTTRQVAQEVA